MQWIDKRRDTSSVTIIGSDAFKGCSGLTSIEIPSSVTEIGECAFYGCSGLTNVVIPSSVTSIGSFAFDGCSGLTSIEIPSSITAIEWHVFKGCTGLTEIILQAKTKKIDERAFSFYCTPYLSCIKVPAKKAGYYEEFLPKELHSIIVEMEPVKKAKKKWKLKSVRVCEKYRNNWLLTTKIFYYGISRLGWWWEVGQGDE